MGQSIFDIQKDYLDIVDELENNGGEITADIEQLLAITEEDFKDKMDAYEAAILTMEQEIILADGQIEKFQKKKKAKQNTIDRLKGVMLQAVKLMGTPDPKSKTNKNPGLRTEQFNFFIRDTKTVEVDPIKFSLSNEKIYPYAKVKLPLELTPEEYIALKGLMYNPTVDIDGNSTKEAIAVITGLDKIKGSIISVQPDKKLLTDVLKKEEERKLNPELPLDVPVTDEVANAIGMAPQVEEEFIPGVKLVTNQSIQCK